MDTDQRQGLRGVRRESALAVLLLLQPAFFFRPLFVETFFFRDMYQLAFPGRRLWAELVRAGQLPVWDPYGQGGQPFLSNVINTVLYPTNVLYLLLPPVAAFNLEIVLHFVACGVAAYLLARVLGIPAIGALGAGIVFEFCGYTLSLGSLFTRLLALPWLPLVLLSWTLWLSTRRRRFFVGTSAAMALQILAGSPELTVLTVVTGALWTAGLSPWRHRMILEGILVVVVAGGLAMPQLLPAVTLVRDSSRGSGTPFATFAGWSVDPRRLPELVLPGFLGHTGRLSEEAYWGRGIEDEGFPYVLSVYLGLPALLLAALAVQGRGETEGFPRRLRLACAALFGCALLFALGRNLPLARLLYAIPPLRVFRFPVKFLMAALIPVALLSAESLRRAFLNEDARPSRAAIGLFLGTGTVALLMALFLRVAPGPSRVLLRGFFGDAASEAARAGVSGALVHAGLAGTALALLAAARRMRPRPWHGAAAVAVIAADLMSAGADVNAYGPRALLAATPDSVKPVREVVGDGRLYRTADPVPLRLTASTDDVAWLAAYSIETLAKSAGRFEISAVFYHDVDSLALRNMTVARMALVALPWAQRVPLLSAAGVRAVLAFDAPPLPGLEFVAEVPNRSRHRLFLYRNPRAVPPARFVTEAERADSLEDVLRRIREPGADPTRRVVLEGSFADPPTGPCAPAEVARTLPRAHRQIVDIRAPCPGYLVLTTPRHRGWEALLDGEPAPLLRADGLFLAVTVPAGTHRVELRFAPPGFAAGLAIAAAAALALGVFLVAGRRGRPAAS
jgi:hypothetical protein